MNNSHPSLHTLSLSILLNGNNANLHFRTSTRTIISISNSLATQLSPYAIPDKGKRESNLCELCKLGTELRALISSNPSNWEFGSWDTAPGYIIVFPSLCKNRRLILPETRL